MLTPLIGFILGTALLLEAVLAYTGVYWQKTPIFGRQKRNLLLLSGKVMIASALILGMLGYFSLLDAPLLRKVRIVSIAVGFLLTGFQFGRIIINRQSYQAIGKSYQVLQDRLKAQWQLVQRYWELLRVLVSRHLKVRYRGSFLGVYWSLLNPLIMTVVYTAIFGATFASYYDNSILNYVLAAFTGLVVINFFSASTSQALVSVVSNGTLLNKIQLPMSIFPVSMITANVFQFAVGVLPLLAVVTLAISKNIVNVIALVLPLISLALVCLGISFLVSALYVFFRDLPYFYELICFVLWISSPVFYPAAIVSPNIKPLLSLNPLSPIIESIRQIALSGESPNPNLIISAMLSGVIIWLFGWMCFHWWRSQFMDLL